MKLITAIIQPQQLPAVKSGLFSAGIKHLTCTNVLGTAPEGVELQTFRGVPHQVTLFQKVRIELAVPDELAETATTAIEQSSKESGAYGFIFVVDLCTAINVSTGKRGGDAIMADNS